MCVFANTQDVYHRCWEEQNKRFGSKEENKGFQIGWLTRWNDAVIKPVCVQRRRDSGGSGRIKWFGFFQIKCLFMSDWKNKQTKEQQIKVWISWSDKSQLLQRPDQHTFHTYDWRVSHLQIHTHTIDTDQTHGAQNNPSWHNTVAGWQNQEEKRKKNKSIIIKCYRTRGQKLLTSLKTKENWALVGGA